MNTRASRIPLNDPGDWTSELCPTGVHIFVPGTQDLAPCFQQLFLLLPGLTLFAVVSAFGIGRMSNELPARRTFAQTVVIHARMSAVLALLVTPALQLWMDWGSLADWWPIDGLVGGAHTISFAVHLGYLKQMKNSRGSHRGNLSVLVLWIALTIIFIFELAQNPTPISIAQVVLLILYGSTLIPSGNSSSYTDVDDEALLPPDNVHYLDGSNRILGNAQDSGNVFSRFFFSWVNPLIDKGFGGHLHSIDDLFQLPRCIDVACLTTNMRHAIQNTPTVLKALHRAHGWEFYSIGLLQLAGDVAGFAGPLLLNSLLTQSTSSVVLDDDRFDSGPYWLAFGLFSTSLIAALSATHFSWRQSLLITKMHVSLTTAIYQKSLVARTLDDATPEVLNLMSTDVERVTNVCYFFHMLWSIPFQIVVSLYLLYTQVGLSFVAGLAFIVVLIPINQWIVGRMNFYITKTMEKKDERVALCTEAISSIKNIKLLAWEDVFIEKILGIRRHEMKFLTKQKYFDALVVYAWSTTKVLMSLLTFGMSVITGHPMTAASTFTTIALLNMLLAPLNMMPWMLSGISETWVSLKRIQELINLPSINLQEYYSQVTPSCETNQSETPIVIKLDNASFTFEKARSREGFDEASTDAVVDFKLSDVNVTINKGELVCLKGPLGGGKSSFLSALLAKLQNDVGTIYLKAPEEGFGYVAQTVWLQRGTIRENIVWGADFDEQRYEGVIMACALQEDIKILGGDRKNIGEGGQTLSGGQRARIALARAVYQDHDVYILDDVLSALDAHVAAHIVRHCVLGLLRLKTRIIVTEHVRVLASADQILYIDNGQVTSMAVNQEAISDDVEITNPSEVIPTIDNSAAVGVIDTDTSDEEESKEYGTLSWDVFSTYVKSTGACLALVCFVLIVLQKLSENLGDLWLAHWVENNNLTFTENLVAETSSPIDTFNLKIYAALAVINSIVTLTGAFVFAFVGLKAAKAIHDRLLKRVFGARFQFFDLTPLGRVLNRFSSDVNIIDDQLPYMLSMLAWQVTSLIAALIISVYALPWVALLVVPLVPVYLDIQNRYRYSSRDVKRLSSNALSPLYAHFTETLQGLTTIRAMTATSRFESDFRTKLSECIRAQLTSYAAENWLIIRLQLLGSLVVGGCGLVAAVTASHASNPGMVGLAISYALSLTGLLEGVLYAVTRTEQQLIAVERVKEYSELDAEAYADGQPILEVPTDWPNAGEIEYSNASLKYRENLEPSLNAVQLKLRCGERVGVAGRTGAGKSSLLAALFRVVPLSVGNVYVDSLEISSVPVNVLRDRLALVPQQPFLFSGSIRENLDPRSVHSDNRIWQVIEACLAKTLIQSMGGLTAKLETNGSNLSAGQRQLLCLARALLKKSKIVCIDEGTANLDSESERDIQLVLREAFRDSTVLLIAHRITSLQNTDRVVVMQEGRVVEDGATVELAVDTSSLFYKMLQKQRDLDPTQTVVDSDCTRQISDSSILDEAKGIDNTLIQF